MMGTQSIARLYWTMDLSSALRVHLHLANGPLSSFLALIRMEQ